MTATPRRRAGREPARTRPATCLSPLPSVHRSAPAIVCLGLSQLIGWGVTFYLIGALGPAITAGLGWNSAVVYGGFSAAIVTMALVSPIAGLAVDRWGGRRVMPAGAVLSALGCVALASAHALPHYYLAWVVLGAGMRLSLYDAAFASLARAAGPTARRPMSQITLFGGLASTVMWPVGHLLAEWLGWRGAVLAYGALALATAPLFLALPRQRYAASAPQAGAAASGLARSQGERRLAGALYALIAMLTNFLAAGNAAHLIAILTGLGWRRPRPWAWPRSGRGPVLRPAGRRGAGRATASADDDADRVPAAAAVLQLALASDGDVAMLAVYALAYGACNGLLTIARGTLPLALFDYRSYGAVVGGLLIPSFLLTAAAPVAYAQMVERYGARGAIGLSTGLAAAILACAAILRWRFIGRARLGG